MKLQNLTVHTDSELLSLVSNFDTRDKRTNLQGIKSFTKNTKMYPYAEIEFDYMVGEEKIRRRGNVTGYVMTNEEVVALVIQSKKDKKLGLQRTSLTLMKTLFNIKKVALVERKIIFDEQGTPFFDYNLKF